MYVLRDQKWFSSPPSSDCEMHYGEEPTFHSTAVSNVCTALCVLTSENRLLTLWSLTHSHDLKKVPGRGKIQSIFFLKLDNFLALVEKNVSSPLKIPKNHIWQQSTLWWPHKMRNFGLFIVCKLSMSKTDIKTIYWKLPLLISSLSFFYFF